MLWQIQPSATPCSPDYSPIPATSYASVSVKLEEESVADNNMEVLLMSKKRKPNPETWKRNVAKDQLNKGLAYNCTLRIDMPAKSMKEPCSLKCIQRYREKFRKSNEKKISIAFTSTVTKHGNGTTLVDMLKAGQQ
jgi:hypothetical protein